VTAPIFLDQVTPSSWAGEVLRGVSFTPSPFVDHR
jgi:hypothetical protein